MDPLIERTWQELMARPDGPFAARFVIQPLIAALLALRDGLRDARAGNPAYLWAVVTDKEHRSAMLHHGWRSIGKPFFIGLIMDLLYQFIVLKGFRPLEAVIVPAALAIVPYLLVRGPVNRIARHTAAAAPKQTPHAP